MGTLARAAAGGRFQPILPIIVFTVIRQLFVGNLYGFYGVTIASYIYKLLIISSLNE
jgi:hypothetical protein